MLRFGCSKPEPTLEPTTLPCNVGSCCVFDVVAKFCTKATNLLKLLSQSSTNCVAFGVGVFGVDCAAGEGRMYTGSGLFWGWAVDFWGSSPASSHYFPHSTRE